MNYKLVAKKEQLTRHMQYERASDLFNAYDIYKANGYDVTAYFRMGETWAVMTI